MVQRAEDAVAAEQHSCNVVGVGPGNADVMIVGIAPGRNEVKQGVPFVGDSGQLLNAILKAADLDREDVFVSNLLCWWNNDPTPEDIAVCWPRLKAEIMAVRPKVIYALGVAPIEWLTGRKASKVRHLAIRNTELDCWVIGSWHPAAALRGSNDDQVTDILRDFNKVPLYVANKFKQPIVHVVRERRQLDWMLKDLSMASMVCCDVEKPGPDFDTIRCFALQDVDSDVTYVLDDQMVKLVDYDMLRQLPTRWLWHNGMYDVEQLDKAFGIRLPISEDTLLMSFTLDSRGGGDGTSADDSERGGSYHGLKRLAGEYCAAGLYGDEVDLKKGPRNQKELESLYYYNGLDVHYTVQLYWLFKARQEADGIREMYHDLYTPSANTLLDIKIHGAYVNKDKLAELAISWSKMYFDLEDQLQRLAQEAGWPNETINLNSPQQLKRLLWDIIGLTPPKQYGTSTQAKALELLDHPFVDALRAFRRVDKMIGSYVLNIEPQIDNTNRIHPTPVLHGPRTGRLAYKNPPVQTIPRTFKVGEEFGRIREMFGGEPGKLVFAADYEQAELWTSAMYSGDETMLADLKTGDFHSYAAQDMFKINKDTHTGTGENSWERIRHNSKFVTFGVLFGRGAGSLSKNELKAYTKRQCQEFIDNWYSRYVATYEWGQQQRRQVIQHGWQRTLSGRLLRHPSVLNYEVLNQAQNYPIQSTAHDILLKSMNELHPQLKRMGVHLWFDIHDALVGEVPEEAVDDFVPLLVEVMTKPRFGCEFGIPVEVKIGPNWKEQKKIKL